MIPMPFIYKNGLPKCLKTGIYSITNLVNGKVYVGSAMCIRGRMSAHRGCLRRGAHYNTYLQRAWDKYGESNFRFDVLKTCQPDELEAFEQHWIDKLGTACRSKGYNLCPTAYSPKGFKHSKKSRDKMSRDRKGIVPVAATLAAAIANKGRKRSEEFRKNTSEKQKGRKKSPEHLAKLKANHWSKRPDAAEIAKRSADKNRGRSLTPEHRRKIAEGGRRRWAGHRAENNH